MKYNSLKRSEILRNKRKINRLFINSDYDIYIYPLKIFYNYGSLKQKQTQVIFSVPKKNIKLAVDRNKLKRQLKEIYRKNKIKINNQNTPHFDICIKYVGKKMHSFGYIKDIYIKTVSQLRDIIL